MTKQIRKITNWRVWRRGLMGAFVGGLGNGITVIALKPEDFNFAEGWTSLWQFSLISAIISAGLYLKQAPVPPEEEVEVEKHLDHP